MSVEIEQTYLGEGANDVPAKRCIGKCQRILPDTPENFHRRGVASGSFGRLSTMCKDCYNERSRDARRREKGEQAESDTSLMQAEMDEGDIPTKCCTGDCGRTLPATLKYFSVDRPGKMRNLCRDCYNKRHAELAREKRNYRNGHLHIVAPIQQSEKSDVSRSVGTPDQCGSCGTQRGNILGDIDETTKERHGYLCAKCYRLVRDFHRDTTRIRNVLKYVEQARLSRVE